MCGYCKQVVDDVLPSAQHMIQRENLFGNTCSKFFVKYIQSSLHSSIFNKGILFLGEKQSMLVNTESNSWHNRVGRFGIGVK